jgi:hypothetical protein
MSCNACFAIGQPLGDSPLICVNVCVLLYDCAFLYCYFYFVIQVLFGL